MHAYYLYIHVTTYIYINTTPSISTLVRYYSMVNGTNNIEMVVIFISNPLSNSTAYHFTTPDIIVNYRVTQNTAPCFLTFVTCSDQSLTVHLLNTQLLL